MSKGELVKFEESIRDRIFSIRGFQVMLDSDLAELYGVETKRINEAIKRNIERFPNNFCFQINLKEYENLISDSNLKVSDSIISRSQIATSILVKESQAKMKKGGMNISALRIYRTRCIYALSGFKK